MLMGPWSPLLLLLPHLDKYITVELVNSSVVGHSSLSLHGVMLAWWCKLWHIVKLTLWCACWFMQIVTYSDALDCGIVQNTSFDLKYDAQCDMLWNSLCDAQYHNVMHVVIQTTSILIQTKTILRYVHHCKLQLGLIYDLSKSWKVKYLLISSFATESCGKEPIMGGMEEGGMTQHNEDRPADKSLETRQHKFSKVNIPIF